MITITKPLPEDAKEINDVVKASWYATYQNKNLNITKADIDAVYLEETAMTQVLFDRLTNPRSNDLYFVAKINNHVVGIIRMKEDKDIFELKTLYVLPKYFGKGIGTMLWSEVKKFIPPDKKITVEVASYTKAKDFYKKIGFVQEGDEYTKEEAKMPVSKTLIPLIKMIYTSKF